MSIIHLTKENFESIINDNENVLVDFWAPWCGPCRMLGPVLEEIEPLVDVKICKVNVDEEPDIAKAFDVFSIPSVFYFHDGNVKDSFVGYLPKNKVMEFLDKQKA